MPSCNFVMSHALSVLVELVNEYFVVCCHIYFVSWNDTLKCVFLFSIDILHKIWGRMPRTMAS